MMSLLMYCDQWLGDTESVLVWILEKTMPLTRVCCVLCLLLIGGIVLFCIVGFFPRWAAGHCNYITNHLHNLTPSTTQSLHTLMGS